MATCSASAKACAEASTALGVRKGALLGTPSCMKYLVATTESCIVSMYLDTIEKKKKKKKKKHTLWLVNNPGVCVWCMFRRTQEQQQVLLSKWPTTQQRAAVCLAQGTGSALLDKGRCLAKVPSQKLLDEGIRIESGVP